MATVPLARGWGVCLALLALPNSCCEFLAPSDFEQRRGQLMQTSAAEVGLDGLELLFQVFVPLSWSTRWSVTSQVVASMPKLPTLDCCLRI